MNKILLKLGKGIIIIFLPLIIFLTILQIYSFNKDFYMKEYEKYNVTSETNMTTKDLERVTTKLISYLKDEEDNLEIKAVIDGENREVFGEREKLHMIDVKVLFQMGYRLRNMGIGLIALSILLISTLSSNNKKDIWRMLLYSSVIPIILMIILFILVQTDFHKYFTHFHEIFFTNDLWLLNPKTDVLIQMLPLGFFMDITLGVLSWFIGISVAMTGISILRLRSLR